MTNIPKKGDVIPHKKANLRGTLTFDHYPTPYPLSLGKSWEPFLRPHMWRGDGAGIRTIMITSSQPSVQDSLKESNQRQAYSRQFVHKSFGFYILLIKFKIAAAFAEEQSKIKNILSKSDYVAITTDMWTSKAITSFTGLTCHFLIEDKILTSKVLDMARCYGIHMAENIASEIRKIL